MTFKEKGYRGGRARQRGSRNVGTALAGARSCFVLLSEGSGEGAWLSWCWCSLGNMCPAGSAGLGGVSRGITAPSAPCCSSLALPCSSALQSYPSVFNLCRNSPPAAPCDASLLPQGKSGGECSGQGEGLGSSSRHFPKCWLRKAADAAQPRFPPSSKHSLAAEPARLSHPIPPHPFPVIPCSCRCW